MAEYKSFHFLMHEQPQAATPFFVKGPDEKPATFAELYPAPADNEARVVFSGEELFWSTMTQVRITMTAHLDARCLALQFRDLSSECEREMRPLFINLELLWPFLDPKTSRTQKGLSESALDKATSAFVKARVKLSEGDVPLPEFWQIKAAATPADIPNSPADAKSSEDPVAATTPALTPGGDGAEGDASVAHTALSVADADTVDGQREQQMLFTKKKDDPFDELELWPPPQVVLERLLAKDHEWLTFWLARKEAATPANAVQAGDAQEGSTAATQLGRETTDNRKRTTPANAVQARDAQEGSTTAGPAPDLAAADAAAAADAVQTPAASTTIARERGGQQRTTPLAASAKRGAGAKVAPSPCSAASGAGAAAAASTRRKGNAPSADGAGGKKGGAAKRRSGRVAPAPK